MDALTVPAKNSNVLNEGGRKITIGFAGNVTTQPFARISARLADLGEIELVHYDYGQPVQALLAPDQSDFLFIHLDHRWFFELAPDAQSDARMDELCTVARARAQKGDCTVVLTTIAGQVDAPVRSEQAALRGHLARLNGTLYSLVADTPGIVLLDVAALAAQCGHGVFFRERNRHLMQVPYSPQGQAAILDEYAAIVREHYRARRKVVVVDADNTLWSGIIGEVGAEGVGVSHDYPQVLHRIFQLQLKQLKDLGFLLVAVTKNNDADFREAFAAGRMPLTLDDFITYRANWNEKSDNIISVAQELNVGLDSMVFIDDNPFEVEEVMARASGVEGHVFPHDNLEAATGLIPSLASLGSPSLTAEDREKTSQYRAEAQRAQAQNAATSLEDYLESLQIELVVGHNHPEHVQRIAQLTNKTNQFNLTTRRYTEADIKRLMAEGDVFDFRLIDKFGDMGIIGVVIIIDGWIDSFLLSCRALGRKVESEILRIITERCGAGLSAEYLPTAKNGQTKAFYSENGFEIVEESEASILFRQVSTPRPSSFIGVRND